MLEDLWNWPDLQMTKRHCFKIEYVEQQDVDQRRIYDFLALTIVSSGIVTSYTIWRHLIIRIIHDHHHDMHI